MGGTTHSRRRGVIAVVTILILLAAGLGVAVAAGEVLGIRSAPGVEHAERDLAMTWCARALLALTIAWIVIGMLSARTRLVRRPGAAAARASWVSSTRPWRAVESMLGMLPIDRVLLVAVPAALLVATRAVQTSPLSWAHLAVVLGAWTVFLGVLLLVVSRRSAWPVIAVVGGVIVLRCTVALTALSFSGPGGYWSGFWTDPVSRSIYISIAFALFVWLLVAAGWTLSLRWGRRRAWGIVLAAVGAALAGSAAAVAVVGLERALIPASTALYAAGAGVALCVLGALLAVGRRRIS